MFHFSSTFSFTLYLIVFLLSLLGLWVIDNRKRQKKGNPPSLSKLYMCEYCQFPYLDKTDLKMTRCPQCKSLNDASKSKR